MIIKAAQETRIKRVQEIQRITNLDNVTDIEQEKDIKSLGKNTELSILSRSSIIFGSRKRIQTNK